VNIANVPIQDLEKVAESTCLRFSLVMLSGIVIVALKEIFVPPKNEDDVDYVTFFVGIVVTIIVYKLLDLYAPPPAEDLQPTSEPAQKTITPNPPLVSET
jgi:hypothetical protein